MAVFKGILLDLGGVVYIGDKPYPGAIDAIDRLRRAGLAVRFLTNTTRTPKAQILQKLRSMGLSVSDEELFTPSMAARTLIAKNNLAPHFLIHEALAEDFKGLPEGRNPAVIVGDAAEGFTYEALNAAFRALEKGAEFIALANNRSFRSTDGELSLDAGAFVAALSFASRKEPVVLGKPSSDFFDAALASMECAPNEAAMVGDDVENDVGGAKGAGIAGVLVQTGKYREGDETMIAPPPDHVAQDLAAAADWILSQD